MIADIQRIVAQEIQDYEDMELFKHLDVVLAQMRDDAEKESKRQFTIQLKGLLEELQQNSP